MPRMNSPTSPLITFIGGGNMASAIVGGLLRQGHAASAIQIVEPWDEQRTRLAQQFPGVALFAAAGIDLKRSDLVVWAVKPQTFKDAALAAGPHLGAALHLSVAAGITSESMANWLGTQRIVRAMPNTPALVGLGMTGLFAREGASAADRALVEAVVKTTGELVWVAAERDLDAVTGSPARARPTCSISSKPCGTPVPAWACRPRPRFNSPSAPSSARPRSRNAPTSRHRCCASGSHPRAAQPTQRSRQWRRRG